MLTARLSHKNVIKRDGSKEIQDSGFPKRNYYLIISNEDKPFKLIYRGKAASGSRKGAGLYIKYYGEFVRVYANLEAYNQIGELHLTRNEYGWEELPNSYKCIGYGEKGRSVYVNEKTPKKVFSVYEWIAPMIDGLPDPEQANVEFIAEVEAWRKEDIEDALVQYGIYDCTIDEAEEWKREFACQLSELAQILSERG